MCFAAGDLQDVVNRSQLMSQCSVIFSIYRLTLPYQITVVTFFNYINFKVS